MKSYDGGAKTKSCTRMEAAKTKRGSNIARRKVEHERPSCATAATPARAFSDDAVGRSPREQGYVVRVCTIPNMKHMLSPSSLRATELESVQ